MEVRHVTKHDVDAHYARLTGACDDERRAGATGRNARRATICHELLSHRARSATLLLADPGGRRPVRQAGEDDLGWPGTAVRAVRLLRTMPRRLLPILLLLAACGGAPLAWEPAAPDRDATTVRARPDVRPLPAGARGATCPGSMGVVRVDSGVVAVWWAVRPDSTALLLSARGTRDPRRVPPWAVEWGPVVAIDTLDRGAHGCARPAPAIALEPRTGYVHVGYAMDAPEGTGVFFAHSMDAGRMWHSPVSIVYGPRLAATAIAARGDTVAVAYEDPNSADPPQVALALSVTAGHLFEHKSIPVSAGAYAATSPEVALEPSGGVVVGWRERRPDGPVAMRRRATWVR
jgi:hypothetical protein